MNRENYVEEDLKDYLKEEVNLLDKIQHKDVA